MACDRLVFRAHAIQRMFERAVTINEVHQVLETGRVIEHYPGDYPYPSRLVLGWSGTRPLHVVAAENTADDETIVITVYEPNPNLWDAEFTRRKS